MQSAEVVPLHTPAWATRMKLCLKKKKEKKRERERKEGREGGKEERK